MGGLLGTGMGEARMGRERAGTGTGTVGRDGEGWRAGGARVGRQAGRDGEGQSQRGRRVWERQARVVPASSPVINSDRDKTQSLPFPTNPFT